MAENNRRGRVQERLAYLFGGGVIAYFFVSLFGKIAYGIEISVPNELIILATAVISFFVGTKAGSEKPES